MNPNSAFMRYIRDVLLAIVGSLLLLALISTCSRSEEADRAPPEVIVIDHAGERGVFVPCRLVTGATMRERIKAADKEAGDLGMFSTLKGIYAAFKESVAGCRTRRAAS